MKTNEYKRPDSYRTALHSPNEGSIQFNTGAFVVSIWQLQTHRPMSRPFRWPSTTT